MSEPPENNGRVETLKTDKDIHFAVWGKTKAGRWGIIGWTETQKQADVKKKYWDAEIVRYANISQYTEIKIMNVEGK